MNYKYKITKGITEDVKKIRIEVFVDEQKFVDEFDELDDTSTHIGFYDNGEIIAICRFFPYDDKGTYKLGRIAVKKSYRGKDVGRFVMETAEKEIKNLGGTSIKLGAQTRAQGFYEKCGFTAYGEVYKEEYCDHIMMTKVI